MDKPSREVMEFMEKHSIDSDEIWEVHGNSWCIKHKALERAGAVAGISWLPPIMIESNSEKGIVSICVTGTLKDKSEWSIGEASPKNNKNAYCYAMAEKRGKDRVILKLLNTHGYLYSESEFDADVREKIVTLPKKDSKGIYEKMQSEIRSCTSREQLRNWMDANKDRILVMPEDWQDILRLQCEEMLADLRQNEVVA
jgi:hypothetical protein